MWRRAAFSQVRPAARSRPAAISRAAAPVAGHRHQGVGDGLDLQRRHLHRRPTVLGIGDATTGMPDTIASTAGSPHPSRSGT